MEGKREHRKALRRGLIGAEDRSNQWGSKLEELKRIKKEEAESGRDSATASQVDSPRWVTRPKKRNNRSQRAKNKNLHRDRANAAYSEEGRRKDVLNHVEKRRKTDGEGDDAKVLGKGRKEGGKILSGDVKVGVAPGEERQKVLPNKEGQQRMLEVLLKMRGDLGGGGEIDQLHGCWIKKEPRVRRTPGPALRTGPDIGGITKKKIAGTPERGWVKEKGEEERGATKTVYSIKAKEKTKSMGSKKTEKGKGQEIS